MKTSMPETYSDCDFPGKKSIFTNDTSVVIRD